MKGFIFFFVFVASSVLAYEIVTDGERDYLLVPLDSDLGEESRVKRQTSAVYDSNSRRATISHMGTLLNNDRHHLSGTGAVSGGKGPLGIGGGLDYTHKPSASTFGASANHARGMGTDVGVSGRYNFVNKPNTQAFIGGGYDRHFGGPGGTGKPNVSGVIGISHKF